MSAPTTTDEDTQQQLEQRVLLLLQEEAEHGRGTPGTARLLELLEARCVLGYGILDASSVASRRVTRAEGDQAVLNANKLR